MPEAASSRPPDIYDVLIVGAGVAGCVLAVTFARQGRNVLLLERDLREPDRILGELLQPGGVAALESLGLGDCLDGIDAIPLRGYRLSYFGKETTFWYPRIADYPIGYPTQQTSPAKLALPPSEPKRTLGDEDERHEGRSFHHGRFIMKLRDAAMKEENVYAVQANATGLLWSSNHDKVIGIRSRETSTEGSKVTDYFAHLTVLADGQSSNLRSKVTSTKPISKSRFYGLLMEGELSSCGLSLGVIGHGPPAGIYQIGKKDRYERIPPKKPSPFTAGGNAEVSRKRVEEKQAEIDAKLLAPALYDQVQGRASIG
ncbi:uncharacterized protein JN550_009054 [Neoarthrinium moseri]|uniref:uncharacterized protein n=1 Tax=Neoarthrinium moseri TaxID=1658444 RepID=UPI001FDD9223|nr:uncharacterized protein JN550_009054 [Neoarthrinium moseri]KAI1864034.1 hypothetical protein JN550_009054 [Neoarthrinium moseri]